MSLGSRVVSVPAAGALLVACAAETPVWRIHDSLIESDRGRFEVPAGDEWFAERALRSASIGLGRPARIEVDPAVPWRVVVVVLRSGPLYGRIGLDADRGICSDADAGCLLFGEVRRPLPQPDPQPDDLHWVDADVYPGPVSVLDLRRVTPATALRFDGLEACDFAPKIVQALQGGALRRDEPTEVLAYGTSAFRDVARKISSFHEAHPGTSLGVGPTAEEVRRWCRAANPRLF